jgi:hypothetical protein
MLWLAMAAQRRRTTFHFFGGMIGLNIHATLCVFVAKTNTIQHPSNKTNIVNYQNHHTHVKYRGFQCCCMFSHVTKDAAFGIT